VQKATDGTISEIDQLLAAKERKSSPFEALRINIQRSVQGSIDVERAAPATEGPDRSDGPLHVAIIMDGNGRWAAARGLPRAEGHRRGVEALRRVVSAAGELGILYLTISPSARKTGRVRRPKSVICSVCSGDSSATICDLAPRRRPGARHRERDGLEPDICVLLKEAEDLTRENNRLHLVVAFNYGSRQEIAHAAQRLAREVGEGKRDPARSTPTRSANTSTRPISPTPI